MAAPPKPHRCWTEAPGPPAGGRVGLEGRVRGSLHPGSCAGIGEAPPYLHLKSQEPAASSTLLGCQSRLSTVERMGFLMCLQTHLETRTGRGEGRGTGSLSTQVPSAPGTPHSRGPAEPPVSPKGKAWIRPVGCGAPPAGNSIPGGLTETSQQAWGRLSHVAANRPGRTSIPGLPGSSLASALRDPGEKMMWPWRTTGWTSQTSDLSAGPYFARLKHGDNRSPVQGAVRESMQASVRGFKQCPQKGSWGDLCP